MMLVSSSLWLLLFTSLFVTRVISLIGSFCCSCWLCPLHSCLNRWYSMTLLPKISHRFPMIYRRKLSSYAGPWGPMGCSPCLSLQPHLQPLPATNMFQKQTLFVSTHTHTHTRFTVFCLCILLTVSFVEQKVLVLMKSDLSVFFSCMKYNFGIVV